MSYIVYRNGIRHGRIGSKLQAAIRHFSILNNKTIWLQNGKLHRDDGPAVEWTNGTKEWWKNGLRHREDGPAIEYTNGYKEYWINDTKCIYSDWKK